MECVEAALKTSFRKEMAIKTSSQTILEDMCVSNAQNGASCDDFFVDELLDFSNQEALLEEQVAEEENKVFSFSVSPQKDTQWHGISLPCSTFTATDDFGSLPNNELSVPADELADLEWLSHFVEDSFSEQSVSVAYSAGTFAEEPKQHALAEDKIPELENTLEVLNKTCFDSPIPAKARSKRTKTVFRVWSLDSPSLTESSSSSTSSSSSSSSPPGPWLMDASSTTLITDPVSTSEATMPSAKKPKKKTVYSWSGLGSVGGGGQAPRRCSHCGVQKTPQWRAGPLGAKTLCNACGVRYKSGRLFPEYRPACSPTFSNENHSNHHRKVLEMRRKKELESGIDSSLTAPAVPSF